MLDRLAGERDTLKAEFRPLDYGPAYDQHNVQVIGVSGSLILLQRLQQIIIASIFITWAERQLAGHSITWIDVVEATWNVIQLWPWAWLILVAIAAAVAIDSRVIRTHAPHKLPQGEMDIIRSLFILETLRFAGWSLEITTRRNCSIVNVAMIIFIPLSLLIVHGAQLDDSKIWLVLWLAFVFAMLITFLIHIFCPSIFRHGIVQFVETLAITALIYYFVDPDIGVFVPLVVFALIPHLNWLFILGYTSVFLFGFVPWFCDLVLQADITTSPYMLSLLKTGWNALYWLILASTLFAILRWMAHIRKWMFPDDRVLIVLAMTVTIVAVGSPIVVNYISIQEWATTELATNRENLSVIDIVTLSALVLGVPVSVFSGTYWGARRLRLLRNKLLQIDVPQI